MLAAHPHDFWDQFYLVTNRLTILVTCAFGAIFALKRCFARHLGVIPRPMWFFVAFTQTLLVLEVAYFMITDTHSLSVFQRTSYGALLIYTIMGLLLIVKRGTDTMQEAINKAETYKEIIAKALDSTEVPITVADPTEEGDGAS